MARRIISRPDPSASPSGASGSNPHAPIDDSGVGGGVNLATTTHPRYDQFHTDWVGLGHVYEGDGPYLDGSALIAHPREYIYARDVAGAVDFDHTLGYHRKFLQRQKLARYENFASTIVDTLVDHQFGKLPVRSIHPRGILGHHPLEQFWENVDGFGLSINEWLEQAMTLAHVYGHVFVLMDRLERVEQEAEGKQPRIRTRAQQSRQVLRLYTPLDAPDWLAPAARLSAIKFVEARERTSLLDKAPVPPTESLVWTADRWIKLDSKGKRLASASHGFGRLPVLVFQARRRARIPILGRSTLRDFRLYRDHYNMISELREIYRAQTFSMLNIRLQENETVEIARARLGDHAGTDAIVFSTGEAKFIAPAEGPARQYAEDLHNLEVKIFRLVGIPFESDSRQGVSEGTARIKNMDLNRMLGHFADQTEALDYEIAALWAAGEYGADAAIEKLDDDNLVIAHPTEFYTEQLAEVVADATATIALGMGPQATALIKKRVVHVALRDISREQIAEIEQEIDERAPYDAEEAALIADATRRSGRPGNNPAGQGGADPSGKGSDPNNDPATGGRSLDPRADAPRPAAASTDPVHTQSGRKPTTVVELRRRHKPLR